ncbi:MAG: FHA domain-containing protein [Polyangiales bacterium]
MSEDLDCSVDYLINESMREYALALNYTANQVPTGSVSPAVAREFEDDAVELDDDGIFDASADLESISKPVPYEPPSRELQRPAGNQAGSSRPSSSLRTPPPLPGMPAPRVQTKRVLVLHFDGQSIPIDKDEFIIGRGSKTADLAIRDGNISRQHAAIVFHDGAYFIKDLGSTNGIEFHGSRIDSQQINDGDRFLLCDHELRFSFE